MRAASRVAAILVCLASATGLRSARAQSDGSDPPEVLRAEACVATDLSDFALNTADPADAVAAALFARCDAQWRAAVDALVSDAGPGGLDKEGHDEAWGIAWAAVRRAAIRGLQSQIIELRAHRPR